MAKDPIKEVRKQLAKPAFRQAKRELLSTGSTLLNLACSGKTAGGLEPGKYYLLVGDSGSGKSFLTLTCFAEAMLHPKFKGYRFIFDEPEDGALMNRERYFGKAAAKIEPPAVKGGEPYHSSTVEEFYYHVDDAVKQGKPFIYVLDSMDSLTTEDEEDQFAKEKHANGRKVTGSYGTAKAKKNSANLRVVINGLKKTNSILIIISQTRDNIGFGSQYNPKTRSGGKSLRFYATLEMWTSVLQRITKKVRGDKEKIGIVSQVQIRKNRIQGREPVVFVSILDDHGIDDVGSMVDFLVHKKEWKVSAGKEGDGKQIKGGVVQGVIDAKQFNVKGSRELIVKHVQDNNLEQQLRTIVAEVWQDIETASQLERKSRY